MKYDRYPLHVSNSFLEYDFTSEGPKGHIQKRILFEELIPRSGVYNLCFGDVVNEGINDLVVTDNRDGKKVLATVSFAVFEFFKKYPTASLLIAGSTKSRTRLYRMAIGINIRELRRSLDVSGMVGEQSYDFKNNVNYDGFMIRKQTDSH